MYEFFFILAKKLKEKIPFLMKNFLFICSIVALLLPLSMVANDDLRQKRDGLESLLQTQGQKHNDRRMELLNHLCDLDMALGDTTYIMPCWYEAELQNNLLSMDDLIISLAIARTLPSRQAAHFTRQLLLSLSSSDVKYCKEYLEFINSL